MREVKGYNDGGEPNYMVRNAEGRYAGKTSLTAELSWQPYAFGYVYDSLETAEIVAKAMGGEPVAL